MRSSPGPRLVSDARKLRPLSGCQCISRILLFYVFDDELPCLVGFQFSHSVVSDSLGSHGLQHTRLPVHHQLPELVQTHVHRVGDAIQPSQPLLSPSLPAFSLSQHQGLFPPSVFPSIRVFSKESVLPIRWPKYWSFSFNISPSNEHPGLISFRID